MQQCGAAVALKKPHPAGVGQAVPDTMLEQVLILLPFRKTKRMPNEWHLGWLEPWRYSFAQRDHPYPPPTQPEQ